jgi:quercetin dioxygenase-like cupin family protein
MAVNNTRPVPSATQAARPAPSLRGPNVRGVIDSSTIRGAQIVLPAPNFDKTLQFFTGELGFKVDVISPADDPARATISAHGLSIRLDRDASGEPGVLRLLSDAAAGTTLTAPNGTVIEFARAIPMIEMPPLVPSFTVATIDGNARWGIGRAGMRYRDLVPDRQGGRFIASHIHIPDGGPVPDYVHYHHIRFQMIYCYRGWARLVYEDQGEPFILAAGDCVLQPPLIRHRVLEASDNLEVIEIGSPAVHDTFADRTIELPTGRLLPERDFSGQRYVRHEIAQAVWKPWHLAGFECRDLGINAATDGVARVQVARALGEASDAAIYRHDGEFALLFVLEGTADVSLDGLAMQPLGAGDSITVPPNADLTMHANVGLELLEVAVPGG